MSNQRQTSASLSIVYSFCFSFLAEPSPNQSAQLRALEAIRYDCQVKSELNLPEIRRNFALGQGEKKKRHRDYFRCDI